MIEDTPLSRFHPDLSCPRPLPAVQHRQRLIHDRHRIFLEEPLYQGFDPSHFVFFDFLRGCLADQGSIREWPSFNKMFRMLSRIGFRVTQAPRRNVAFFVKALDGRTVSRRPEGVGIRRQLGSTSGSWRRAPCSGKQLPEALVTNVAVLPRRDKSRSFSVTECIRLCNWMQIVVGRASD
jgi:hypothetical protein